MERLVVALADCLHTASRVPWLSGVTWFVWLYQSDIGAAICFPEVPSPAFIFQRISGWLCHGDPLGVSATGMEKAAPHAIRRSFVGVYPVFS